MGVQHDKAAADVNQGIFTLIHPGTCTGMFWRDDPRGAKHSGTHPPWPRNGAVLKGVQHTVKGTEWLECVEYRQRGSQDWKACTGCWIPFHQGGLLLHAGDQSSGVPASKGRGCTVQ
mmetsp:Transcript_26284/g.64892  ORF Transcript_26284/g.64892 Transcript_26284/m.64892 type:complete len:117 (-) Transcript_26284:430-780(-)